MSILPVNYIPPAIPTILTLFYNEGIIDYSNRTKINLDSVVKLITEKNPDILFIGTQETNLNEIKSLSYNIGISIKDIYTKIHTEFGGDRSKNKYLSIGSIVAKTPNNICSSLFIKNGLELDETIKIEKFGDSCKLASIYHGTAYKDSILFKFSYNNIKYCIVNSHLSYTDKTPDQAYIQRSEQFICLLKKVSKYVSKHNIIFGGDLNFRLLPKEYVEVFPKLQPPVDPADPLTGKAFKGSAETPKSPENKHNISSLLTSTSVNEFDNIFKRKIPLSIKKTLNTLTTSDLNFLKQCSIEFLQYVHDNPIDSINHRYIARKDIEFIKTLNKDFISFLNKLSTENLNNRNRYNLKTSNNKNIFRYNELSRLLNSKQINSNNNFITLIEKFKENLKKHAFCITCRYREGSINIEKTKGKHVNNQQRPKSQSNSTTGLNTIPQSNIQQRPRSKSTSEFPSKPSLSIPFIGKKEKTYRMPSMCDRILYSFLDENTPTPSIYTLNRAQLKYSDHLMICGEFYM
jgi:hypothetical protein